MVFKKLFKGLAKTGEKLSSSLKDLFTMGRNLDDDFIEELEEVLYSSDMGSTAVKIIDDVREAYKSREVKTTEEVYTFLKGRLKDTMHGSIDTLPLAEAPIVVRSWCYGYSDAGSVFHRRRRIFRA